MRRGNSIRIGSIAGVPIILDFSFFISLALITVLLGSRILPSMLHPDPSDLTIWALALGAAALFFISLLLHELAHSVVARLYGMHVHSITLFLLGGVSQIAQDSTRASQEFVIAFVGPLTSAILGAGFIGLFVLLGSGESPGLAVVLWLGIINLSLAAFNLLPGFPLDGGRVFRALVWGLTGSRTRATRYAARLGQVFGVLLAGLGLLSFLRIDVGLGGGGFSGLWLVFIGAFLFNAAAQSLRALAAEETLGRIRVRDVMSTNLRTVDTDSRVSWLAASRDLIDRHTPYLITRDEMVVGIVTGAQIAQLEEQRYDSATMGEVMVHADAIAPIDPDATGQEALERLQSGETPVLPVVENGRLLGLVGLEQMLIALRGDRAANPA